MKDIVFRSKTVLLIMLAVIATLLPYIYIHYDVYFTEEPYGISRGNHYLDYPMIALSDYLSGIVNIFAHDKFINFRIVTILIKQLLIALSISFYYRRTKNTDVSIILWIASVLLVDYWVFDWNLFSYVFIVVSFLLFYEYCLVKRNYWLLSLCGVTSALAIGCRMPDIFIIPFVLFGLLTDSEEKNKVKASSYYLVSSLFSLFLIYTLFYGNVITWYHELVDGMINAPKHDVMTLIEHYLISIGKLIRVMVYVGCTYVIIRMVLYALDKIGANRWISIIAVMAICVMFYRKVLYPQYFECSGSTRYMIFKQCILISIWIFTAIVSVRRKDERSLWQKIWIVFTAALFSVISISGSDTGLMKCAMIWTFPILLLKPIQFTKVQKSFYFVTVVGIIALVINMSWYYIMRPCTEKIDDIAQLEDIKVTPKRKVEIESVNNIVREAKGDIMVVGKYLYYSNN